MESLPLKLDIGKDDIKIILVKKKVRNHGIDFIRIISMYGIVFTHLRYRNETYIKYKQFKELKLLHIFLFWHNNGFAFISGFIGHKTNKYYNLFYLWICVCFYSVNFYLLYLKYNPQLIKDKFYHNLFPIIFERYWYFTAYFGMNLFLPIINKGIAYLNKLELKICVISILSILVFWHDIMNLKVDIFKTFKGYSLLWLLIFYITGAYFGKYRINLVGTKKFIFCLINFLVYITISVLYYKLYKYKINSLNGNFKLRFIIKLKQLLNEHFDSNLKVMQSISIILVLLQINYNKYFGKIISFIGTLTFGVYLIHFNKYVRRDILRNLFKYQEINISLLSIYRLFIIKSLLIFIICLIIDYMRFLLFNYLKIKNICIILEKKIFDLLN